MTSPSLLARMQAVADRTERELERLLPVPAGAEARLHEAMRHAALGGGKRVRPFLVHASADLFDEEGLAATVTGTAVELVHAYSLVHDDLPAMDDAELRRGRPACHRAFDEATAILAGDALQALAFGILADEANGMAADLRAGLVTGLARAAGHGGMCGGQQIDLEAEGCRLDLDAITRLQELKTGALIAFSLDAGWMIGKGSTEDRHALAGYGADLGLAFQIRDDLLDLTGDPGLVGKDLRRDGEAEKATFPSLMGTDEARAALLELRARGCARLDRFGDRSMVLREFFDYVINREL
ncbi:MAG: polyprenyl synthetase family protein [Geminicoccaceae bacterium]